MSRLLFTSLVLIPLFSAPAGFAFEIPSDLGRIEESQAGTNGKTFFLIQEAHVDYGAQKAISGILRELIQREHLKLILVEGGWEDVSLSYLRNYTDAEGRREVAERFLKDGLISGEEYLDITSNLDMSLWGIENADHYRENMETFLALHEVQETLLRGLAEFETYLKTLRKNLFPEALEALEAARTRFARGKLSLLEYALALKHEAGGLQLQKFPRLSGLLSAAGAGEAFDVEKVNWEKQKLIKALSKNLTKHETEQMRVSEERKNLDDEYLFLIGLMKTYERHKEKLSKVSVSNLSGYLKMLEQAVEGDTAPLFSEIETLETEVIGQFALPEDAKQLLEISRAHETVTKLIALQLNPETFQKIEDNPRAYEPGTWVRFLKERDVRDSQTHGPVPDLEEVEKWIPAAKAFYESARKREAALIENAVRKLEQDGETAAALVVGGFHAERMKEALGRKGYSVVLIAPRFTPSDPEAHSEKYFNILKHKWNHPAAQTLGI